MTQESEVSEVKQTFYDENKDDFVASSTPWLNMKTKLENVNHGVFVNGQTI